MVLQSQKLAIPLDVVERGVPELSTGVRITIEASVRLWRAKRMAASELELLLSSVAWQSPTLREYFEGCGLSNKHADCAVLSDEDMAALMDGRCEEQGQAKRRATSTWTGRDCTPSGSAHVKEPTEPSLEILSSEDMLALVGGGTPVSQSDLSERIAILAISSSRSPVGFPTSNHHGRETLASVAGMKTVFSCNIFDDLALFADSGGVESDDNLHMQEVLAPLGSSKSAGQLCQCVNDENGDGGDLRKLKRSTSDGVWFRQLERQLDV